MAASSIYEEGIASVLLDGRAIAECFAEDGVVIVRKVLGAAEAMLLEEAFVARLQDPATTAPLYAGDNTIVQSHGNSPDDPLIARLLRESALADLASRIFHDHPVWYWSEQAWWKKGGAARRTAWHQDLSYVPFAGPSFAVLWIPLDPLSADSALEVVRGSHRQTLYNGTRFDPDDEVAPIFDEAVLPRLPDIEAERERWEIVSGPLDRGDVLVFHPACLHGGAPTKAGRERRSMSFRFFSDDVVYRPLPKVDGDPLSQVQEERADKLIGKVPTLAPGEPIYRCGSFAKLRDGIWM